MQPILNIHLLVRDGLFCIWQSMCNNDFGVNSELLFTPKYVGGNQSEIFMDGCLKLGFCLGNRLAT